MNRLEQYIRENAAAFDTDSPSREAEERFLEKWEAGRRRVRFFRTVLPAVAAAALAVLLLLPPAGRSRDWLRGAENTPEGIYRCYMAEVVKAWDQAGGDESLSSQLRSLTEETIPMIDQLPEELDPESRTVILREHYNTLLNGMHQLMANNR